MALELVIHASLNTFLSLTNYSILHFFIGLCPGPCYSNFPFTISLNFEIFFFILAYLLSSRTTHPPAYSTPPLDDYFTGTSNSTGPKFTLPLFLYTLASLLIFSNSVHVNGITLYLGNQLRNPSKSLTEFST